jgi:hypothetical protein
MQINSLGLTFLFISLISIQCYSLTTSILVSSTSSTQHKSTVNFDIHQFSQLKKSKKQDDFTLLTRDCFMERTCLAFVYVKKKFFNKKKLIELSNLVNKKNKEKERLTVFFFDELAIAQAHAQGKSEPRDLENDAKGLFRHDTKEEYLKIRLAGKMSYNWSRWKIVFSRKF